MFKHIQNRFCFSKIKDFMFQRLISEYIQRLASKCAIPEKSKRRGGGGVEEIIFSKKPRKFWIRYFILGSSRESKTSLLDIPHSCVAPLGNSKVKNQGRWKHHMIFS